MLPSTRKSEMGRPTRTRGPERQNVTIGSVPRAQAIAAMSNADLAASIAGARGRTLDTGLLEALLAEQARRNNASAAQASDAGQDAARGQGESSPMAGAAHEIGPEMAAPEPDPLLTWEQEPKRLDARGQSEVLTADGESGDWPEPEPLQDALPDVAQFDLELMPESFRPLVKDVAERMQVPLDFPAAVAIATFAGVTNRRAVIQPKAERPYLDSGSEPLGRDRSAARDAQELL